MEMDTVGRWTRLLSQVALALAGLHLLVAVGVAIMPPRASSEGGPEAGLLYALYYAAPLAVLGLALRSRSGWLMAGVAVLALALVAQPAGPSSPPRAGPRPKVLGSGGLSTVAQDPTACDAPGVTGRRSGLRLGPRRSKR